MDLNQLIELKKSLMSDFTCAKQENSKLRDEMSKDFSKSIECVLHKLDVESSIDEFYDYERKLVGPDLSTYTVYTPKSAAYLRTPTKFCKGCIQQFKTDRHAHSLLLFYEHCIRDCEEYKKLDLIRSCDECRLLFISSNSYRNHVNSESKCEYSQRHRNKPDWAPKSMKLWNSMHSYRQWNTAVNCKGCGQQFRAREKPSGSFSREIAFYRHCFDECEEYQKLDLIRKCSDCNQKFINIFALNRHCGQVHKNRSDT